jgi:hypothetical protein
MNTRRLLALLVCAAALLTPPSALADHSLGTSEQIAWVRRAATNFVTAELSANGAGACGILNAPLRASRHGRSCEQRWKGKLAALLRQPGARAGLRRLRREIASAVVVVHGNLASIELSAPLMGGPNHFLWTENCWMLES